MSFIAFSGIDGAGKTTQIELLVGYFKTIQQKSIVIWARGGYTPGINWIKNILRKSNSIKIPSVSGRTEEREQSFKNPTIRKVWLMLAIFDLIWIYGIKVRWLQLRGYQVIFDRFIEDTLMDFNLNFPQEEIKKWWLWDFLTFITPRPHTHFILLIPVEESQRRSLIKNEPFPDSVPILERRVSYYKSLIRTSSRYILIDCMNPIDKVFEIIKKRLK